MEGFSPQRSPHPSRSPHPARSPHPSRSPPPSRSPGGVSRSPHPAMSGGVPGSRSPSVSNLPEANPLKVSIALGQGKQPAIIQKGPFYLMKPDPIVVSEVTGATNLMQSKNLEHSYTKLASKKMKDSLSSFLPGLPGVIDTPGTQVINCFPFPFISLRTSTCMCMCS